MCGNCAKNRDEATAFGAGPPTQIPNPLNDASKGQPVPEPNKLPPGTPKGVKPVKINTARAQAILEREIRNSTPALIAATNKMWRAQIAELSDEVIAKAALTGDLPDSVIASWEAETVALATATMVPQWDRSSRIGFAQLSEGIKRRFGSTIAFDDLRARIAEWVDARSLELINGMTGGQLTAIRETLKHYTVVEPISARDLGYILRRITPLSPRDAGAVRKFRDALAKQKLSSSVINRQVASYTTRLRRARALTIARTEVSFAYNRATMDTMREAQIQGKVRGVIVKRWWTALDNKVSTWCQGLHGVVVGLEGSYPATNKRAPNTLTPPAHPNCRCSLLYEVLVDEKRGDLAFGEVVPLHWIWEVERRMAA